MIAKGLKIGDTFTDGSFLYKVTSYSENGNYISSLVGMAGEGVKPEEEEKEVALEDMPYSELKALAKEKGVSAKGSKEEVIERLRGI